MANFTKFELEEWAGCPRVARHGHPFCIITVNLEDDAHEKFCWDIIYRVDFIFTSVIASEVKCTISVVVLLLFAF